MSRSQRKRCHSVRQARERRKRLVLRNLSLQPCGLANPARQSLASSRKRVLRGGRKLQLRSVDSESQCRAIEPRNLLIAEATVVDTSEGRAETPQWPGVHRSYRGPRTGRRDIRVAREPERPCRFRRDCRLESRLTNSRLIHSSIPSWWGRTAVAPVVSPSEGNEVRRDGRQGVAVPHSSDEAGERALPNPGE